MLVGEFVEDSEIVFLVTCFTAFELSELRVALRNSGCKPQKITISKPRLAVGTANFLARSMRDE